MRRAIEDLEEATKTLNKTLKDLDKIITKLVDVLKRNQIEVKPRPVIVNYNNEATPNDAA